MILRDSLGNAVGHTEVIETVYPSMDTTPAAYLPAINQTDAQAFVYALNSTAY